MKNCAKNRLTSAIESVALVSRLADAFVLSGRVVAAGIGVASVRSGRALVVFLAREIVDTSVAFDAQTLVRALRVVADRVGTAAVSFRTAYRLAFVDICRGKAKFVIIRPDNLFRGGTNRCITGVNWITSGGLLARVLRTGAVFAVTRVAG
jgi:hypothetical protein